MNCHRTIKKLNKLFLLAAATLLVGCSSIPVGKYGALNDANKQLLAETGDTYVRIEKLQRYFTVVTAPNKNINADSFKPAVAGQNFDITPELRFRESALEVLFRYTTFLSTVSAKDYQSDVDKASQDLAGSMKNFVEYGAGTPDARKVSGIAATFINIISRQAIEHMRSGALRKTMDMAQNDIKSLSNLIIDSNEKIKEYVGLMQERIIAHANAARPVYGSPGRLAFDLHVAAVLAEIEGIQMSLDSLQTAIAKIPDAHKEIRRELDKKPTSFDALQGLIQEAQRVNKFYRSLEK